MPRQVKSSTTKPEPAKEEPAEEGHFTKQFTTAINRDDLRKAFRSGRSYIWPPNGKKGEVEYYISVTNALNGLPKEAIPRWAAKTVAEHAVYHFEVLEQMIAGGDQTGAVQWLKSTPWSARDTAADIGSAVHAIAELDVAGEREAADALAETLPPEGQAKVAHMRHFFRVVPHTVKQVESVVYNDTFKYAGTLDFILNFEDPEVLKLWPGWEQGALDLIIDIKTGSGVYDEVALQLAAYRHAEKVVELDSATLEPMPETDGGGVLHLTTEGWELIPVDTSKDAFRKFCRTLALAVELPLSGHIGTPALRGSDTK